MLPLAHSRACRILIYQLKSPVNHTRAESPWFRPTLHKPCPRGRLFVVTESFSLSFNGEARAPRAGQRNGSGKRGASGAEAPAWRVKVRSVDSVLL